MTVEEILADLDAKGKAGIKALALKHGVKEPLYGVTIEELKKIQKKIKKNHALSMELYRSGVADAQYLAGLIADEKIISPDDLREWTKDPRGIMITEYIIPWVAAESGHGYALALEWIDSEDEQLQVIGWATMSYVIALTPDEKLDLKKIKSLLSYIQKNIHKSNGRLAYVMNGFITSTGIYSSSLHSLALETADAVGQVAVDMNGTSCKVPEARFQIQKSVARNTIGKKKKTVRC